MPQWTEASARRLVRPARQTPSPFRDYTIRWRGRSSPSHSSSVSLPTRLHRTNPQCRRRPSPKSPQHHAEGRDRFVPPHIRDRRGIRLCSSAPLAPAVGPELAERQLAAGPAGAPGALLPAVHFAVSCTRIPP